MYLYLLLLSQYEYNKHGGDAGSVSALDHQQ